MKPSSILKAALCATALAFCAAPAGSQTAAVAPARASDAPELPFHLVENFFKYPPHYEISRLSGVAVSPKTGRIVSLNRGPHPVLEFNADGSYVGSWGEDSKMFEGAHVLRFDPQGNLWYVDAADNVIFRFDAEGRTAGILGTDDEAWTFLTHVYPGHARGKASFYQETDIGWTKNGHSFISDGYGNSRVVEFDQNGNYVKEWGERGAQPGNFNTPHSLVVGDDDTIYVADRANQRIQSFDPDGKLKAVWPIPGLAFSICITKGPHPVMFAGAIGKVYKLDMTTGKIIGQFGRNGRFPGTIDAIHQLACPDEKTLYLANLYSGRLDKWVMP
jgi:hypothetical protein